MGLATEVGAATFDRTANTFQLDLSTELAEIIRPDNTAFLDRVGSASMTATQRIHYWTEDKLNPYTATAAASLDASATSIAVATGQGARFVAGTLFKDKAIGKTEVIQVTGVSTDTLTIVRGYGSTTGETHASLFEIQIIAHTKQEGWKPTQEDWTQERSSAYNRVQVFGMGITLARERQLVDQTVIASEIAHQSA